MAPQAGYCLLPQLVKLKSKLAVNLEKRTCGKPKQMNVMFLLNTCCSLDWVFQMVMNGGQRVGLKSRMCQYCLELSYFHICNSLTILSGHLGTSSHLWSIGLSRSFGRGRFFWFWKIKGKDTEIPKSTLLNFDRFRLWIWYQLICKNQYQTSWKATLSWQE